MIVAFANAETANFFRTGRSRRWAAIQKPALRRLLQLHAVTELWELSAPPGNRLERLQGDRFGQHSIRINDQWRLCFRWDAGNVYDVEIVDYH